MTQAELQELVEKIRASEFRREALPAGADSISQAMPIKGLLDEKGELIPNWFDCADGFDKRYNWQIDGSPKRMIVRADINALGKIGIADSVRIVTGQQSGYDDIAANDDYGYPNAAEIRDAESGEEVIAFNNPTSPTVYPYWFAKGSGWVKKTKREWFLNSRIEELPPGNIVWAEDTTLPLVNPKPPNKGKVVQWDSKTVVNYSSGNTIVILSDYNTIPDPGKRGIDVETYFSTETPEDVLIDLIKQWLSANTFNGIYSICRYTPNEDWYGSLAPFLVISPSGYLMSDNTIVGAIESTRRAYLDFKAGNTGHAGMYVTGMKDIWVPWGGRFFITTDETDEIGINLASWGCDRYGESFQSLDSFGEVKEVGVFNRYVPPMFFRKGVTYYVKAELRNAIICDYRETGSMTSFLNSTPLPWLTIFPQMVLNQQSAKERFLPLYIGAKRLYRMAYEVGKGPNITQGTWPNGKIYIEGN